MAFLVSRNICQLMEIVRIPSFSFTFHKLCKDVRFVSFTSLFTRRNNHRTMHVKYYSSAATTLGRSCTYSCPPKPKATTFWHLKNAHKYLRYTVVLVSHDKLQTDNSSSIYNLLKYDREGERKMERKRKIAIILQY